MQGIHTMQVRRVEAASLLRDTHSIRARSSVPASLAREPVGRLTRMPAAAALNAENLPPRRGSVGGLEHLQHLQRPPVLAAMARAAAMPPPRTARSPIFTQRGALQDITNSAAAPRATLGGNVKVPRRPPSLGSYAPPAAINIAAPWAATASVASTQQVLVALAEPAPTGRIVEEAVAATGRATKVDVEEPEVDEPVPENLREVAEYLPDILGGLFREESAYLSPPSYMDEQPELNSQMRGILVDWLVEVHTKYHLRSETLFLTMNIIDRYLSVAAVPRRKLQLIGVVAMFIAAKFEEVDPLRVADFCYITDNSYSSAEIIRTESRVLAALGFRIVAPTPAHFMDRLSGLNHCDARHRSMAQYLLELSLTEMPMLQHRPSRLVAAALLLSNELMGRGGALWPASMARACRQEEAALRPLAEELRALCLAAPRSRLQATRRKFLQHEFHCVAETAALRA